MRILLIADSYPPEVRSASRLTKELAVELAARGHAVTVLTCVARYNLPGAVTETRRLWIASDSRDHDVRVLRFWVPPLHGVPFSIRLLSQLSMPVLMTLGGIRTGKPDAIVTYSPPLTLGVIALLISLIRGGKSILNVQDLYPDTAIKLGFLRNPLLVSAARWLERFLYRHSHLITIHSAGNKQYLLRAGVPEHKAAVVPNWVDLSAYQPRFRPEPPHTGTESRKEFVVLFAGVMGYAQDLETVVDCASFLRDAHDIRFLLVGDGAERRALEGKAAQLNLTNVTFRDFVPLDEYPRLVSEADLGLVTLKASMDTPVVPSKLLGYMAAGLPVICSLPGASDACGLVNQARCGQWVQPGDAKAMAEAIFALYLDASLCREMGRRGREFAREHFSLSACVSQYEELLEKVCGFPGAAGARPRHPETAPGSGNPRNPLPDDE